MKNGNVEKRIFECSLPEKNGDSCPVACKFKANNNGERPIPEAYYGNPESEFMILGINPNGKKNDRNFNLEEYQDFIRNPRWHDLPWSHRYVARIFGYDLEKNEGIVTNLVHCPTPSWSTQRDEKWRLSDAEKKRSIELCSPFCSELVDAVDSRLILLHGLDVVKFFSRNYNWGISENARNRDIHGLVRSHNGYTFVLSRHLASIRAPKGHEPWTALEEAAKKVDRNRQ